MPNQNYKNEAFHKLDNLCDKYMRVERLMHSIQEQMENCFNGLEWQKDKEMMLEIIHHLPQCYLRFRMIDRYYLLKKTEENKSNGNIETASPQEGGDENA